MMQPAAHKSLDIQHSDTSKIVELSGYVVIVVQSLDGKVKLFGSPADKDNLEVADEVLNVNERVLGDLPHAEVVRYLHECVRSCLIKLRVKRRSDARLSFELANSVQDAFVIAVEEQAKVRLQRLLALQRVKPVDMSLLSMQLNNQQKVGTSASQQDFSFLKEGSPIYVTSLSGSNVTSGSTTHTTDSGLHSNPTPAVITNYPQQASFKQNNNQFANAPNHQIITTAVINHQPTAQTAGSAVQSNHQHLNNHKPLTAASSTLSSASSVGSASVSNYPNTFGSASKSSSSLATTKTFSTNNNNHITTNASSGQPQTSFDTFYGGHSTKASTVVPDTSSSNTSTVGSDSSVGLANGHIPKRELSTLSEVDSDPTDDSFGRVLYPPLSAACQVSTGPKTHADGDHVPLSSGGAEVLLGDQSLRQDNRPRRRSGSSIVVLGADELNNKIRLPGDDDYMSGQLTYSPADAHAQLYNQSSRIGGDDMDMLSATNQDNGPYQEMAVDVPASFIARNKTPPRYPPPRPPSQVNSPLILAASRAQPQVPSTATVVKSQSIPFLSSFQSPNSKHTNGNRGHYEPEIALELQPLNTFGKSATNASAAANHHHHNHAHNHHNHHHHHHHHSLDVSISPPSNIHYQSSSPSLNTITASANHGDFHSGMRNKSLRSSKAPSSLESACESIGFDSMSYRTKSKGSVSSRSSSSDLGPPEYDMGPHRELPVDVPENFVEVKKSAPRYPPPAKMIPPPQLPSSKGLFKKPAAPTPPVEDDRPSEVTAASSAGEEDTSATVSPAPTSLDEERSSGDEPDAGSEPLLVRNNELNGSVRPVPPPRDHLRIEKDGRLVNRAPAPQVPDRRHPQHADAIGLNVPIAQIVAPTNEQLDSIKKYQEQLRRRHEEQDRVNQQNDFMRASLRESRKLQSLQANRLPDRPSGVENTAYTEDEDFEPNRVIPSFEEMLTAMLQLHHELSKNGMSVLASRIALAQQLLNTAPFQQAVTIRAAVLERRQSHKLSPVCGNSQVLIKECLDSLADSSSSYALELTELMSTYEMEGLMLAHDRIATLTDPEPDPHIRRRDSMKEEAHKHKQHNNVANIINNNSVKQREQAITPPMTGATVIRAGDARDPIRIIQIEKSSEPLGATILNEGEAVVIGRIVRGGAAEKSGLLHERDEILEVNGIEMSGRNVNDVCALLSAMTGTLTFLIVPAGTPPPGGGMIVGGREPAVLHVRAHFDYDPEDDRYIPCRELGISFQKGDVLHVISREDSNWWQAYREGEDDQTLAGLIPSQSFQHQREAMRLAAAGEAGLVMGRGGKVGAKGSTLLCMKKAGKNRKKKMKASSEVGYPLYATTTPDDPDPEEILTYEEVSLYYPRASHKRPIVLIGPPNIGRHELRQRLMADSDRFAAAVPHTSRARRDQEMPGQDYHFISRVQFEADILSRKFVEHGEYERAYYGTSLEAIRAVVSSGKICVLNLHPQSLKLLRASDLKPYVVLVAPPSLEKLRQKKVRTSEPVKEDDLKEIIATARDMEARWGHLFDMIIINNDTERAYHQLLSEINSLEREPQWVPASWINS